MENEINDGISDEELIQIYKQKYTDLSLSISEDTRKELESVFSKIDDYLDKGIVPEERRFTLPKTPSYLQELGSDETVISLPVSVIKKAKETHRLSNEEIKKSLLRFYDPVVVFDTDKEKSENKQDSKLILTDEFAENKPIALAVNTNSQIQIQESGHRKFIEVQDIRSIHDRTLIAKNGTDLINQWTGNGLCRYVDDKKISDWSTVARVYFPIEALQSDENNILIKSEIVNSQEKPELKTYHKLKKEEIDGLKEISQEEFNSIIDALYQQPNPDYKKIPPIIKLPQINEEISQKLGVENANFFMRSEIAHVRPQRKGSYDQALRIEEMKGMLDFIKTCQTAYIDNDEKHQNFMLTGVDEQDNKKSNKIVFNKDEYGNYIVTVGKVKTEDLNEKQYSKVAVGVEPTIWRPLDENPIATMLRSSTTLLNENIQRNSETVKQEVPGGIRMFGQDTIEIAKKIDGLQEITQEEFDKYIHSEDFISKFGDWEKASRLQKLAEAPKIIRNGKIIIDGKDITEEVNNFRNDKDNKVLRSFAKDIGRYVKGTYHNDDLNIDVVLSMGNIDEIKNHHMAMSGHLEAIQYIPDIIKQSIYIAEEPNEDKEKHPNIEKYKYFVSALNINNVDYTCKSAIGVDKDGNHYYDQRLSQIEKGLLLDNLSQLMSRGKSEQSLLNYDKRLLRICQCPQALYLDKNLRPTMETVKAVINGNLFLEKDKNGFQLLHNTVEEKVIGKELSEMIDKNMLESISSEQKAETVKQEVPGGIRMFGQDTIEIAKKIEEKEKTENQEKGHSANVKKVDIVKKGATDFLNSVKNGTAPFLNKKGEDFGKITINPPLIVNAYTGLPFSGEAQLLSQIYYERQQMQGEIVTSFAGAKSAGTAIVANEASKKNFVLADTHLSGGKNVVFKNRYFSPEACEEPEKIYALALAKQRPQKLEEYRYLIKHFEKVPNGQKEIADIRTRIAEEHLKELRIKFASVETPDLSLKEIAERKDFIKDYFNRLPNDVRDIEKSTFQNIYGIVIDVEKDFSGTQFSEAARKEMESHLSEFVVKNSMSEKKLASLSKSEYEEQLKIQKQIGKSVKIDATGIKEPELYLGKYLAACQTNAEFITDSETIDAVQKNLAKKLETNFRLEKFGIVKEIGRQAERVCKETVQETSFKLAHSNKKENKQSIEISKSVVPGMGK